MNGAKFEIHLRADDGRMLAARVTLAEIGDDDCQVTLTTSTELYTSVAGDYFQAFVEIRKTLWARGLAPLCFGALENVFPSPMSRQMGARESRRTDSRWASKPTLRISWIYSTRQQSIFRCPRSSKRHSIIGGLPALVPVVRALTHLCPRKSRGHTAEFARRLAS